MAVNTFFKTCLGVFAERACLKVNVLILGDAENFFEFH